MSYPGIAVDVPYLSPECIASNSMGDRILTKYEIMTIDTGYYSLPDLDNYGHSKYLLLPWLYAADSATTGGPFPCKALEKDSPGSTEQVEYTKKEQVEYTFVVLLALHLLVKKFNTQSAFNWSIVCH